MPTVDPDVRATLVDILARAMLDARVAARDRYDAEVKGAAVDADPLTWQLTMASGRTAGLLELVAALYGPDQLGPMCNDARRVADRADPEVSAYVPRSPQEQLP